MKRDPKMQRAIDDIAKALFGHLPQHEAEAQGICVTCGNAIGAFRDQLSVDEYGISGMCQKCQDEVFGM